MNGLIIIPVFNEQETLPNIINAFKSLDTRGESLYIDDGSSDRSAEILRNAGVSYLSHPYNIGYKAVLQTGMQYAIHGKYDFVSFFDADGQHQFEDLVSMIDTFEQGESDLIIGSRFVNQEHNLESLRYFVNRVFSLLVRCCTGQTVTDSTSGLKLISRRFINVAIALPSEDMHAEFIIALIRSGARYKEISIKVNERKSGNSMYHFSKAFFYPLKTVLCVMVAILFNRIDRITKH